MNGAAGPLAFVVADIKQNRMPRRVEVKSIDEVAGADDVDDLMLEGVFFAVPRCKLIGELPKGLTRDDQLAMAHAMQQRRSCEQDNRGDSKSNGLRPAK